MLVVSEKIRPPRELVAEMENAVKRHDDVALLLCENHTDRVHLCWFDDDKTALENKIKAAIEGDCIPLGLLTATRTETGCEFDSIPLREHQQGNGIARYLQRLTARIQKEYDTRERAQRVYH